METANNQIVIAEEDYETINNYVKPVIIFNRENAILLLKEIKKATMVKRSELPQDVVRLNSKVIIKEESRKKLIELILVVPENADINKRKVSIFAPIGVALLGFRQGEKVRCDAPSGNKVYRIMNVCNKQAT